MSRKKDENFYEDEDEDTEEDVNKCPPQQVPWPNPNEERASHRPATSHEHKHHRHHKHEHADEEAVAIEEGVPLEEKAKIKGADPQNLVAEEGIGTDYPDKSGGQHVGSPSRNMDISPDAAVLGSQGRHRRFIFEESRPGAVAIPGIDTNEGDEDQATCTTDARSEEPTVNIVARVVDTEEENRRLYELRQALHERNQAIHERDRLRRMVQNAVVVTSVVATNRDVEAENDKVAQVPPDSEEVENEKVAQVPPDSEGQEAVVTGGASNRRRQWQLGGAFLLVILIVLAVVLSIILSKEPEPSPVPEDDLRTFLSSVSSDGGEALRTPSTPQNKALEWLASKSDLGTYTSETIIQRYALATLYFSTNGDSWYYKALWLSNDNECNWWQHDLGSSTCSDTGAVANVELHDNDLKGPIPPEIGLLTNLKRLWLDRNALNGTVPTEIGLLTQLTSLNLHENALTGTIPSEAINSLPFLDYLWLYDNSLTGNYTCPDFVDTCFISCYENNNLACGSLGWYQ